MDSLALGISSSSSVLTHHLSHPSSLNLSLSANTKPNLLSLSSVLAMESERERESKWAKQKGRRNGDSFCRGGGLKAFNWALLQYYVRNQDSSTSICRERYRARERESRGRSNYPVSVGHWDDMYVPWLSTSERSYSVVLGHIQIRNTMLQYSRHHARCTRGIE